MSKIDICNIIFSKDILPNMIEHECICCDTDLHGMLWRKQEGLLYWGDGGRPSFIGRKFTRPSPTGKRTLNSKNLKMLYLLSALKEPVEIDCKKACSVIEQE